MFFAELLGRTCQVFEECKGGHCLAQNIDCQVAGLKCYMQWIIKAEEDNIDTGPSHRLADKDVTDFVMAM
jgi:hypothetical protein